MPRWLPEPFLGAVFGAVSHDYIKRAGLLSQHSWIRNHSANQNRKPLKSLHIDET